ncbi:MAG: hypothetical protein ABSE89_01720 [Sedimentisphaerales bacterium]
MKMSTRASILLTILIALLVAGFSFPVSAGTISLICDTNMSEPNEEVTVYIQTDTPLFAMGIGIYITGDANITTGMCEADCNEYGWDNGWNSDPYIDPNGYIYLSGVRWASNANGIISYIKFRYNSGQVSVYIDQENSVAFSWDGNSSSYVPFSTDTLVFGEPDPNDYNEENESSSQDTIIDENAPAEDANNPNDINLPQSSYWQNKQALHQKHLMRCPADSNSSRATFDEPNFEAWNDGYFQNRENIMSELTAGDDGGQILTDSEPNNTIIVDSDITTNQIWTANNVYYIVWDINVQALLVIEPGTEIWFESGCTMYVNNGGTLISVGTPEEPIIYSSAYYYPDPITDYYNCAIYVEETASPSTRIAYNYIEYADNGIVTENIRLDHPIENNYLFFNINGIFEYGTKLTDIKNNLIDYGYTGLFYSEGIEIYMESSTGLADANSCILIQNNTCDYLDFGITIHGTEDDNDAGSAILVNNLVTQAYWCGLNLVDGWIGFEVDNTGYGNNWENKNYEFNESNPAIIYDTSQNPYRIQNWDYPYTGIRYLDPNCIFINAGLEYIEQTSMIGMTTDVNGLPDCNIIDIGFHHPNWNYSNAGQGDYYAGDLDRNLIVDFNDFAILANGWRQTYNMNDLIQMCSNWLIIGGPEPNIIPVISGDSNSGYVFISVSDFPTNVRQIAVFDDGKYIGKLYGFDDEAVALDVSESGSQEHQIKLVSIAKNGQITCSHISSAAFSCPLQYCIIPSDYEPNEPINFTAFNPGGGNVSVELLADGGVSIWSNTYSGNSFTGSIPAGITGQHYLDYITLLSVNPGPAPIKRRINPRIRLKDIDPATEALIINPDLYLDFVGTDMLNQVERAFIQNGIKFKLLGWAYATSLNIAAYSWICPIRYLYVFSHGYYQHDPNGGVLRTRVLLTNKEIAVSVKQSDFPIGGAPSWCVELEPDLEYSPVLSWAAMNFHSLEFAYFNCCYSGKLKINASNQLVIGQPGQQGVFDLPQSDMSYALGIASTSRDCAYQGWYEKPWFALGGASPFNKWTLDEWSNLALGLPAGSLDTALQAAIKGQHSFIDPNAPANSYRLRGQGLLNAIGLHHN